MIRDKKKIVYWLVGAFFAIGLPALFAWGAWSQDPGNWQLSDTAGVAGSVASGVGFLLLALILNRNAQLRARAVADSELITSMGALAMSSARTFVGDDQHALRVAADARAALQHYPRATRPHQVQLTRMITASYSDLAFGTFARVDALPRSISRQLADGAAAVIRETEELIGRLTTSSQDQRRELEAMRDHVCFVRNLGDHVRRWRSRPTTPGREHVLVQDSSQQMLPRFARLYEHELTVIKQWNVLIRDADQVECAVRLHHVTDACEWYAPWYVQREQDGLRPVNVLGNELDNHPAGDDRPVDDPQLAPYPAAIRHDRIPRGMRTGPIEKLRTLLARQLPVTVCVLLYGVKLGDEKRYLVLDGNHRLAAARALGTTDVDVRVLAFVIDEKAPVAVDTAGHNVVADEEAHPGWQWMGFTPDVGLMHGWRPGVGTRPTQIGGTVGRPAPQPVRPRARDLST